MVALRLKAQKWIPKKEVYPLDLSGMEAIELDKDAPFTQKAPRPITKGDLHDPAANKEFDPSCWTESDKLRIPVVP